MNTNVIMTFFEFIQMEFFIYRSRYLIFLFIVYILVFAALGLLFDLSHGFYIGPIVGGLISLMIFYMGEKIILVFAKARYVTDDELLINQVKNFCTHVGVKEAKVYWSNVYTNNFYYAHSHWGVPTLIIGKNVYKSLTRTELNSLIYASLLKIKNNEAKHRTIATLMFFMLYSPLFALKSLFQGELASRVLNTFLYPAYFLKSMIYERADVVMKFDQLVGSHQGLRKDYLSALFKIHQLPSIRELSVGGLLINDLIHVKNQTDDVFGGILIEKVSVDERVKALK
jgi:hypothetical protein